MFLQMLREMYHEIFVQKEIEIWDNLDDLEMIDKEVNLLNKKMDDLLLLFDYLELCPASEHRDNLLSKLINEFELRAENKVFYIPAKRPLIFSFYFRDRIKANVKKFVKETRKEILWIREQKIIQAEKERKIEHLRDRQSMGDFSGIILLPGQRPPGTTIQDIRMQDDMRSFLHSKREKINLLRRDRGKDRALREEWDRYVISEQLKELLGSKK